MSTSPRTTMLTALVGAVLGSVLTSLVLLPSPQAEVAAADPQTATEVRALREQVQRLDERTGLLLNRVRTVELAFFAGSEAPAEPARLAPSGAELVAGVDERPPLVAAKDTTQDLSVDPEALVDEVVEALAIVRAAEELERDAERAERREARIEERLAELAEELSLDTYQKDELKKVMTASQTKRDEIRDSARDSGDWTSMRDAFESLRDQTNEKLAGILLPYQLEKLDELGGLDQGWDRGRRDRRGD